ncbi:hypothetical protein FACS189490_12010 [Clostridia bacterium]|nr:hypothetical protein FACS189490_12010 [Clostridia bacterium]
MKRILQIVMAVLVSVSGFIAVKPSTAFAGGDRDGNYIFREFHNGLAYVDAEEPAEKYFIDTTGKKVIDVSKYRYFYSFEDGVAIGDLGYNEPNGAVVSKYGAIDTSGKTVVDFVYDALSLDNGVFIAKNYEKYSNDTKYRIIDKSGRVLSDFEYNRIESFSDGFAYAVTYKEGEGYSTEWHGFIDKAGKKAITAQNGSGLQFSDGLASMQNGTFIDTSGKVVISGLELDGIYAGNFSEGLAPALSIKNDKYGYIDKTGKVVIDFLYDEARPFDGGLAPVVKSPSQSGYIDKSGKFYDYSWKGELVDGLSVVMKDDKWGFIDKTGSLVIPLTYSFAYDFNDGFALVETDKGKWCFINSTGKVVINFKDEWERFGERFSQGLARIGVRGSGSCFYIDKSGKIVLSDLPYGRTTEFSEGYMINYDTGTGAFKIFANPVSNSAPTVAPAKNATPAPTASQQVAQKVGDKVGDVLFTDIKASINGSPIPACNISGSMYVFTADLSHYGFNETFDEVARATTIKLVEGKAFTPLGVAKTTGKIGDKIGNVLYTNIKTYILGKEVTSVNVDNKTAVPFEELKVFGAVKYDDKTRSITLTIK